jgi:hypothetical protein
MAAFRTFDQMCALAQDAGLRATWRYSEEGHHKVTLAERDAAKLGIGRTMILRVHDEGAIVDFKMDGVERKGFLSLPQSNALAFKHGVVRENAADAALMVWGEGVCIERGWPSVFRTYLGD